MKTLMSKHMLAAENRNAADVNADPQVRATCIARICTRALGADEVGLDDSLLYSVDVAIRAAVLEHLTGKTVEAEGSIEILRAVATARGQELQDAQRVFDFASAAYAAIRKDTTATREQVLLAMYALDGADRKLREKDREFSEAVSARDTAERGELED